MKAERNTAKLRPFAAGLIALALLLSACGTSPEPPADGSGTAAGENTLREPDGSTPGTYRWPADLLPEGFPAFRGEVDLLEAEGAEKQKLVIGADAALSEMKAYVGLLIAEGWGSYEDGLMLALTEAGLPDGMTADQIAVTCVSMGKEFAAGENAGAGYTYCGEKDGTRVLCRMAPTGKYPFTMWVYSVDPPARKSFSAPRCSVTVEQGWEMAQADGRLTARYTGDPTGTFLWSLTEATTAGQEGPEAMKDAYLSFVGERAALRELTPRSFEIAGSQAASAVSFVTAGTLSDIYCVYAAWRTTDGRTWELTLTAPIYDTEIADRVLSGLLAGFGTAGTEAGAV